MELSTDNITCCKCGTKYSKRSNNFYSSYGNSYKGTGYLPICKTCIDTLYNVYYAQCKDEKTTVRQMCRKLDIYWNETIYESSLKKSKESNNRRTLMGIYLTKINGSSYMDKSYDDTLLEEGSLWNFQGDSVLANNIVHNTPQEVIDFWGAGYSDEMYEEFEKRKKNWMSKLPADTLQDAGTEAIIKQICMLETDITRDRIADKPVDKNVNALNSLLGSANLKPTQQKSDTDNSLENIPMGVWIKKFETKKPVPEADPELQDADGLLKYILTWMYGHLAKMLNIKNAHSKLYDDAIEKLRVDHPEYTDEEDDEEFLYDIFKDGDEDGDGSG